MDEETGEVPFESGHPHLTFAFLRPLSGCLSDVSIVMETRASTRSRTRSSQTRALQQSSKPGLSDLRGNLPAMKATAGIFPLLDAETAQVVLSYLPSGCLGDRSERMAFKELVYGFDVWRNITTLRTFYVVNALRPTPVKA